MNKIKPLLILSALFLSQSFLFANPIEIIYEERPPYVKKNSDKVDGLVASPLFTALESAKIEYTVKEKPSKRHLYEIEANQKEICAIGWFKNSEREKIGEYTKALYKDQPMGILVREENGKLKKSIKIDELLSDKSLSLLVKASYSYGQFLDDKIKQYTPNAKEVNSDNVTMADMVAKNRADYMLMSFEEANEILTKELKNSGVKFMKIEGMPEGSERYLICSKMVKDDVIELLNSKLLQR